MTKMYRRVTEVATLSVFGLLSACGGGGGSSSGTSTVGGAASPVVISDANAPTVAAQAMDVGGAGGLAGAALSGVQINGPSVAAPSMGALLDAALKPIRKAVPSNTLTGVTVTDTLACSGGGSVTVTFNTASSTSVSAGDQITMSYNNCIENAVTLTGQLGMTVRSANQALTYLDVDATFTSFTGTLAGIGERLDGNLRVIDDETVAGSITLQVNSSSLTLARLISGSVRTTRTLTGYTYQEVTNTTTGATTETFAGTASGNFPKLGNVSWSTTTIQPIVTPGGATYPTSGSGRVTGANGATITATVVPTGLSLSVDRNGDAVVDSSRTLTWAEVEAEL